MRPRVDLRDEIQIMSQHHGRVYLNSKITSLPRKFHYLGYQLTMSQFVQLHQLSASKQKFGIAFNLLVMLQQFH